MEVNMKFNDLVFKIHPNINAGFDTQATIKFDNGYGASIVTGRCAYTDAVHPYELAVLKNGSLCYDTEITNDVIGHLNKEGVEEIINKIEKLDKT